MTEAGTLNKITRPKIGGSKGKKSKKGFFSKIFGSK